MPDRTDLIEVTHNTWVKPSAITLIQFTAAPLNSKDVPPCPAGMALVAWAGPTRIQVVWFDGSDTKAFTAAQERARKLIQRVNAANREADRG